MRRQEEKDLLRLQEELERKPKGPEDLRLEVLEARQREIGRRMEARRQRARLGAGEGGAAPWKALLDPERECWYYYNEETLETSWEPPPLRLAEGPGPTAPQPEEPPAPWCLALDEDSGTWYYHNAATGETSWELPADEGGDRRFDEEGAPKDRVDDHRRGASPEVTQDAPAAWVLVVDEGTGGMYYHNAATGETAWALPDSEEEAAAQEAPEPWRHVVDSSTGAAYFHNTVTNETAWELPDDAWGHHQAGPGADGGEGASGGAEGADDKGAAADDGDRPPRVARPSQS